MQKDKTPESKTLKGIMQTSIAQRGNTQTSITQRDFDDFISTTEY